MFGRDDDQFIPLRRIERFGHTDGIMPGEVPFVPLADVVHIDLKSICKLRGFSGADEMRDLVPRFCKCPAVNSSDNACADDQCFHVLSP